MGTVHGVTFREFFALLSVICQGSSIVGSVVGFFGLSGGTGVLEFPNLVYGPTAISTVTGLKDSV